MKKKYIKVGRFTTITVAMFIIVTITSCNNSESSKPNTTTKNNLPINTKTIAANKNSYKNNKSTELNTPTNNAQLIGRWQTVDVFTKWISEDVGYGSFKGNTHVDTNTANLIALNFIDTTTVFVTFRTYVDAPINPYIVDTDTTKYLRNENYLWIDNLILSNDMEITKLTSDTLVLKCYEQQEEFHNMVTYTMKRK